MNADDVSTGNECMLTELHPERLAELENKVVAEAAAAAKSLVPAQDASKTPALLKLARLAHCLDIVAACQDGDELKATVVEKLRPMVAGSDELTDKVAREMSSRYTSITASKGHWTSRTIAKLLRERPKLALLSASMVELTHVGVAQQVLRLHDGNLRTIVEQDKHSWLKWETCRWARLADKQVGALVGKHIDVLKGRLLAEPGLDVKEARAVAMTLGHTAFNSGVVSAMGHEGDVHVNEDDLNTHSEFLAVANGAVHLPTATLVADRELLLTVQSKTAYVPDAPCPLFLEALRTTFEGRTEDIDYYELLMGYTVLGAPSERAMFFHVGEGNNGKSLLLGAISHALGREHAPVINFRLIASEPGASIGGDANAASPAQFKLRNARLGYIDELPKSGVMRDAAVKLYAGGTSIDARQLNHGLVDFDMTASIHVNCNAQVAIRGAQRSTWHRVCPVAYRASFKDDPTLPGKLKDEAEGVLSWLVRCAQQYLKLREKGQELRDRMPASAHQELAAMKRAQDPLADWLDDCCELTPDGGMPSVEGWKAFAAYHADRDSELPMSVRTDRLWAERVLSIKGVRDAKGNLVLVARKDDKVQKRSRGFYGIQLKGSSWATKVQLEAERAVRVKDGLLKLPEQLEDPDISKRNGVVGTGWMREEQEVAVRDEKGKRDARERAEREQRDAK